MKELCRPQHEILALHVTQGSQSHGQHDGVHGFPEPVKLFINFIILSQISCGKVQKNPSYFFCTRLCQSFSWVCCSFQDYLKQLLKKRKILHDWVHTSVVWGNLENCSVHRRNFYTGMCRKIWGFFCTLPHEIRLSITKVMNDFPYLWCPITGL